jgi:glycosyltransferase involved in cell wall biosynthesis
MRWAIDPLTWRGFSTPIPRIRACVRRSLDSLRLVGRPRGAGGPAGQLVGYLRSTPSDGSLPLYSASHPVTGDQLLTTSPRETADLGYERAAVLGYLAPEAPLTGRLGTIRAGIPWASRFGLFAAIEGNPRAEPLGGIDSPEPGEVVPHDLIQVSGWALLPAGSPARVEVFVNGMAAGRARVGVVRPDVAADIPHPEAELSGYELALDPARLALSGSHAIVSVLAYGRDGAAFRVGEVEVELDVGAGLDDAIPRADRSGRAEELRARVGRTTWARTARRGRGIRLLTFTHSLDYGGAQLYLVDLLRRLTGEPDVSTIVVSPEDGPLRDELSALGITVHVTSGYPVEDVEAYEGKLWELASWAGPQRFDAVLVNTMGVFPAADLATRFEIPCIWAIHESFDLPHYWLAAYGGRAHGYALERGRLALRNASAVVFAAAATQRQYERYVDGTRFVTLPYGLDLPEIERCRRRNDDRSRARRALGLDPAATVVLCLATIEPRKCQTSLVQAFSAVAGSHPDAVLALVGEIPNPWPESASYSAAVRSYAERAGRSNRIRVAPVTSNPYAWHCVADILVQASDVESLPFSVLEAMAFETPVLATRVFGLPELIEDGKTGYLCDARDVTALAEGLDRVLTATPAERRSVGLAGAAHVGERHDPDRYAESFKRLLGGLIENPRAVPSDLLGA